jgi:methyl coenzyme M reductase subunit D
LILVIKQENVGLPIVEPIVAKNVHVVIRMKYSELRFNQLNGSIVIGILRDWSKGIHNVNRVLRPNFPRCTYCHQIGHQINECPFIEDYVRQGFAEHFQNLNPDFTKVGNHGHIEPKDLYHDRVIFPNRFKEQIWRKNKMEMSV